MHGIQRTILGLLYLASALLTGTAAASDLHDTLEKRLAGDRSGVCVAAVQLAASEETAVYCANPDESRAIDAQSRFEIGSLTKALQGLLVARLAERGELSIDEPVAALLPDDARVPEHEDGPIRIRHLLTHTAGLPRLPTGFSLDDPANPYAGYTPEDLLSALAETELASAPGAQYAYSNFGAMLLSLALVEGTGTPLPELFEREVFEPLGMDTTSMDGETEQGHSARGKPVSNWDFHPDLGGVGAIRSTAANMRRWLDALRGDPEGPLADALARSREVLIETESRKLGYGWLHLPLNDRFVLAHDGGTGGFSSFAVVDPDNERASLVLMDTSMIDAGSLSDLAFHLVDDAYPLKEPRVATALPAGIDPQDYVGRYAIYQGDERLMGDFTLEVMIEDGQVLVQGSAGGQTQPEVGVDPDGRDRFVNPGLKLAIEFERDAEGSVTGLVMEQAGVPMRGEPL
jgi:CubicO group peptidase (beta-lactamase class C family)